MRLLARVRANLSAAHLDRREIAGSLGDLGTFLPLLVGMAAANGLDFASSLFFAGLASVLTGLLFPVPMAVQPMKAIAAVAITEGLSPAQIVAAGATVGAVQLTFGLTGLIGVIDRAIPRSVVRGLQLGLGLALALKGWRMIVGTDAIVGADSYLTAGAALLIVLGFASSRKAPAALVLFVGGLILTFWASPDAMSRLSLQLWTPALTPPGSEAFAEAFVPAAIPQIPLTTLNSVIAVCALSLHLFPDRPIRTRDVASSVGLMNLLGMWIGAMPLCHGAGGLAGQHRFGARTNGSILFLGGAKMALAVAFGGTLMALCQVFPASVLGVMLGAAGYALATAARDQRGWALVATLITAVAILLLGNTAYGLGVGLAAALLGRAATWIIRRGTRARRGSTPRHAHGPGASRSERPASSDR